MLFFKYYFFQNLLKNKSEMQSKLLKKEKDHQISIITQFHRICKYEMFKDPENQNDKFFLLNNAQLKPQKTKTSDHIARQMKEKNKHISFNMGVKGLWTLIAPTGRKINLEHLRGRRLAIDISIWVIQYWSIGLKMTGKDFKNIHLKGIMKRIIRLLMLGIKPVFVFDGKFPEIKRKTMIKRREIREKTKLNMKFLAQKYMMRLLEGKEKFVKSLENTQSNENLLNEEMKLLEKIAEIDKIENGEREELLDYEYEIIVEENKDLLIKYGVNLEQFYAKPIIEQFAIVDEVREKLREEKIEKYLTINNSEELSKMQISDYMDLIFRKKKTLEKKIELNRDKIKKREDFLLNQDHFQKLFKEGGKMKTLLGDPNAQTTSGPLASDHDKQFLLISLAKKKSDLTQIRRKKVNTQNVDVSQYYKRHLDGGLENNWDELENMGEKRMDENENKLMASNPDEINRIKKCKEYLAKSKNRINEVFKKAIKENNISSFGDIFDQLFGTFEQNEKWDFYGRCIDVEDFKYEPTNMKKKNIECKKERKDMSESENELEFPKNKLNIEIKNKDNEKNIEQNFFYKEPKKLEIQQEKIDRNQLVSQMFYQAPSNFRYSQHDDIEFNTNSQIYPIRESGQSQAISKTETTSLFPDKYQNTQSSKVSNNLGEEFEFNAEDFNFDDEDINLNKYDLYEEFQKYQNLQNSEDLENPFNKFDQIRKMLQLFGIPWVDSPCEAEAQCAFLEQNNLVDGIITEDSDIWLFGARNVFRNFFFQGNYAYAYTNKEIEENLGLSREKLILMALFLGSDYTLGIRGVGIVNAMEIVEAFDSPEALLRLKEWAKAPDLLLDDANSHYENVSSKEKKFKEKHKNYKKSWELPDSFPDLNIIDAYQNAYVNESKEKFGWGKPDIETLKQFSSKVLGLAPDLINLYFNPLEKCLNEENNQSKLSDYFQAGDKFAYFNSKRLKESINNLSKGPNKAGSLERENTTGIPSDLSDVLSKNKKIKRQMRVGNELKSYKYVKENQQTVILLQLVRIAMKGENN